MNWSEKTYPQIVLHMLLQILVALRVKLAESGKIWEKKQTELTQRVEKQRATWSPQVTLPSEIIGWLQLSTQDA